MSTPRMLTLDEVRAMDEAGSEVILDLWRISDGPEIVEDTTASLIMAEINNATDNGIDADEAFAEMCVVLHRMIP
jgi:hypothetical protein